MKINTIKSILFFVIGFWYGLGGLYSIVTHESTYYRWDLEKIDPQTGWAPFAIGICFLIVGFITYRSKEKEN